MLFVFGLKVLDFGFVCLRGILMIVRYRVVLEMVWLIVSYSLVMMNYMRLLIVDVVL